MTTCGHCKSRDVSVGHVRDCTSGIVPGYTSRGAQALQAIGRGKPSIVGVETVSEIDHELARKRAPVIDAGMYRMGDHLFKVQKAVHGSGHLYAKRFVPNESEGERATFEYAPGVIAQLSALDRLSLEDAKGFGALYGTCCVCGAVLTNEVSIEAGIGPICAGRL